MSKPTVSNSGSSRSRTESNELVRQLQFITNHLNTFASYIDQTLTYRYMNAQYRDWFELPEDFPGVIKVRELVGEDAYARAAPFLKRGLEGERLEFLNTHTNSKGRVRHLEVTVLPDKQPDGTVAGIAIMANDITEKREAELMASQTAKEKEELQEKISEARAEAEQERQQLRKIFMEAPAIISIVKGPELIIDFVNNEHQNRVPIPDIIGKSALEAIPQLADTPLIKTIKQVFESGETIRENELRMERRDPETGAVTEEVFFNFIFQPYFDQHDQVEGVLTFAFDVTAQVQARQVVERSAKQLRTILESIPEIAWTLNAKGDLQYFNQRWYDYTGLDPEAEFNWDWDKVLHPEDLEKVNDQWWESIKSGTEMMMQLRFRRHDGEYRWFQVRALPLYDEAGNVSQWVGISSDMQDQVMAREKLQSAHDVLDQEVKERTQELLEANHHLRMVNSELNKFAYVISHDLKAPLRGISSLSKWIEQDYADKLGVEGQENLQLLRGRVKRMHELIEGILQYSRANRSFDDNRQEVNLDELVKDVIRGLEVPEHIQIKVHRPLPVVWNEDVKLFQVFQNLLSNAIRFIDKEKGLVEVDVEEEGEFYRFSIRDNGIGIPERFHERIFELFQTLERRDTFESTGVGLAIVKKIVEFCGGKIWIESEPGEGTTFFFTLPKHQEKMDEATAEASS